MLRSAAGFAGTILCAALASGCIPVAMFPSEHRLGGGLAGGDVRNAPTEPTHRGLGAQFHYRGAIAPLAMVPELWDRDFDFDLAYVLMVPEVGSFQHGPSVGLSYFAVRESLDAREPCALDEDWSDGLCTPPGEHQLFRVALRVEADARFSNPETDRVGFGGRGGLRLDFSWMPSQATPVAGATGSRSAFVGVVWGEYGVALDFLGGGGFVGQQAYGELVIAITGRVPAIAGLAIGIP